MKASQLLPIYIATRKRLDNPEHWCKGFSRKDSTCIGDALLGSSRPLDLIDFNHVMDPIMITLKGSDFNRFNIVGQLVKWNDSVKTTHKDVLKALDDTIAYLTSMSSENI